MAALRHAARKLVGTSVLISPPAVVAEAQPRRLIHGSSWTSVHKIKTQNQMNNNPCARRSLASSTSEPAYWLDNSNRYCFDSAKLQIRDKKEELYSQLAELSNETYLERINKSGQKEIKELLRDITKHVDPKPNDRTWRKYRQSKRFTDWDRKNKALSLYVAVPGWTIVALNTDRSLEEIISGLFRFRT